MSKVRKWYPKSPPSDGEAFSKNRGIVLREEGNYRRTTKGKRKRKVSGGGTGMVLRTQGRSKMRTFLSLIHLRDCPLWKCPMAA